MNAQENTTAIVEVLNITAGTDVNIITLTLNDSSSLPSAVDYLNRTYDLNMNITSLSGVVIPVTIENFAGSSANWNKTFVVSAKGSGASSVNSTMKTDFGTKVYDFYGSRETASLAGECDNSLIHIFSFNHYVEIIDQDNNPVKEDNNGRIIVTTLHNYSMPLLRYEIGDTAIMGSDKCECGRFLPNIKKINGRIEEQFIKKDGNIVIGYFFVHLIGVLLNKGLINKFQVIQEEYDKIIVVTVIDKNK